MKVEQLYTGCLAEAAYYIESNGEVAIIDPLRETGPYLERAESDCAASRDMATGNIQSSAPCTM